jgi:ABC-type lipoprotein release transport system permease subunit
MIQDLLYALRLFRRDRAFSAAALLTIAIGIGASTAVFSIVYNVLVRPLPYPNADRLVRVWEENPGAASSSGAMIGRDGDPIVVQARPLGADITARIRPALVVLAAAVSLLLLVGCANVANLLLWRGVTRRREIALRGAVGASGARLVRQLLTENAILGIAGGAIGIAIGWSLVRLAPVLMPPGFPRITDIQVNAWVLSFAVAATVVTTLVTGLVPAVRGTRLSLIGSLRGGQGGPSSAWCAGAPAFLNCSTDR